jgi:hypothetical protein
MPYNELLIWIRNPLMEFCISIPIISIMTCYGLQTSPLHFSSMIRFFCSDHLNELHMAHTLELPPFCFILPLCDWRDSINVNQPGGGELNSNPPQPDRQVSISIVTDYRLLCPGLSSISRSLVSIVSKLLEFFSLKKRGSHAPGSSTNPYDVRITEAMVKRPSFSSLKYCLRPFV